jgi:hypothetical protein
VCVRVHVPMCEARGACKAEAIDCPWVLCHLERLCKCLDHVHHAVLHARMCNDAPGHLHVGLTDILSGKGVHQVGCVNITRATLPDVIHKNSAHQCVHACPWGSQMCCQ